MDIKVVTVIGVTGTMGANVAGIFASFGNAKVYLVGRDIEKVKKTIPRIVNSVRADSISDNLIPKDFSSLCDCVKESDLVFESSVEDMSVKMDIAKKVASALKPTAISCTGTSGLSIKTISECYPENLRGNFFGVHMFNPPYSLTLCELISTEYTDKNLKEELKKYLSDTLLRTVVEVKDSPAFLGNRIGFHFINRALQYAYKYRDNGGIDYIDSILGPFTGRSMPPLMTSDFVGLDVHKAIVDNIYNHISDIEKDFFVFPEFAQKLVSEGKLGRKSRQGLYKTIRHDDGTKNVTVLDIESGEYRDVINYGFSFARKMKGYIKNGDYEKAFSHLINNRSTEAEICVEFLLAYILYSLTTAKNVSDNIDSADDVMATGFNWCPPLAMYNAFSAVTDIKALIEERIDLSKFPNIDLQSLLSEVKPSKYDFRPFFKSNL